MPPTLYTSDVSIGKPKPVRKGNLNHHCRMGDSINKLMDAKAKNTKEPVSLGEALDEALGPAASSTDDKKTKAALARAANRQRKKEEAAEAAAQAEKERLEQEGQAAAAAEAAAAKKAIAAEKRRLARENKKRASPSPDAMEVSSTDAPSPAPTKKPRKAAASEEPPKASDMTQDTPPKWFTKYMTEMITEKQIQEGTKVAKKELKRQGEEMATNKWADPHTRTRVRNSVDQQQDALYSMIFA